MKARLMFSAVLLGLCAQVATADHAYMSLDDDGDLVASGPFNLVIPRPPNAETITPRNSHTSFGLERLRTSRAGYFDDYRVMIIEVETTDGAPGTIDYSGMPMVEMAGLTLPSRRGCLYISDEELDADDEPLLELMQQINFDPKPAMYGRQVFLVAEDGKAEGIALYARRVDNCDTISDAEMQDFDAQFERFIKTIRAANAPAE
jgi:hypothetical protein